MTTRRDLLIGLAATPLLARRAAADTVVLRAGDQKGGTQSVMKAAGVLEGLPYRLDWSQFAAAAPLLEALNAGAVDLAFAGDAPTTFALAAGVQARIVSPIRTSGAGTAILVPPTSPIRTIADLRGRSIATNRGSIGHALVLAVIEAQGWKASDIRLVNLLPAEANAAFSTGSVDAWCSWGVYVAQARLADGARIVVDGGNGLLTGLSYLVATDEAIARRRAALLDFTRRLAAARHWAKAHPEDYARVLATEIGVSQPVARLVFDTETPWPVPIDATVIADEQKTADRYLAAGLIRTRLDAPRLFDASFNEALSI
jgi:sulfonate transport system substrate-binding protein